MPLPSADPSTADPPASDRVGPRRLNRIGVKLEGYTFTKMKDLKDTTL